MGLVASSREYLDALLLQFLGMGFDEPSDVRAGQHGLRSTKHIHLTAINVNLDQARTCERPGDCVECPPFLIVNFSDEVRTDFQLPSVVRITIRVPTHSVAEFGGWLDRIVGRIADTIMAFPLFVLAMGIVAALGNTVQNIIIATAIVNFPLYARVARAEANVRRGAGFVQAARLSGNGEFRILLVHILPNIMPIMIVQMSLTMGYAILNAAGLSFIGLGVRPPTAEWGIMVAEGASFMVSGEWWIALFPGLALMIAVFCFNLLGDGLRDIVDPQRRT